MADFAAKTHAKEVVAAAERKSLAAFVEPVRGASGARRRLRAAQFASGAGRQEMLIVRMEIGNRTLEPVEDSRPKFHTVEICP